MNYTDTQSLNLANVKTYIFASAFIFGNILFPQLCHLIPRGGLIFLPIYFFTLIGAYRYGKAVGLLTAILSPLINCAFFGMPPVASLPAIMIKSVVLAWIASSLGEKNQKVSIMLLLAAVAGYQFVGMCFEFAQGLMVDLTVGEAFMHSLQDVRIGFPGLLIQVFLGYVVIKKLYGSESHKTTL